MTECESKVLVEEVPQELAHAQVGPAAMHKEEALQEAELCDTVITCQDSLHAFHATDTHTYMSSWTQKKTHEANLVLHQPCQLFNSN